MTDLAYGPEVVVGTPSPPDDAPGIRDATRHSTICDDVAPAQVMVEPLPQHLVVHGEHVAWCFRTVEKIERTVSIVRLTDAHPPAGRARLAECLGADV